MGKAAKLTRFRPAIVVERFSGSGSFLIVGEGDLSCCLWSRTSATLSVSRVSWSEVVSTNSDFNEDRAIDDRSRLGIVQEFDTLMNQGSSAAAVDNVVTCDEGV